MFKHNISLIKYYESKVLCAKHTINTNLEMDTCINKTKEDGNKKKQKP